MELKFRIWDSGLKSFRYFNLVDATYNMGSGGLVTQFTGVKDQNGIEIYEGDIVENANFIGVVEFKDGFYFIQEKIAKIPLISNNPNQYTDRNMGALYWDKVIGNIFENTLD